MLHDESCLDTDDWECDCGELAEFWCCRTAYCDPCWIEHIEQYGGGGEE